MKIIETEIEGLKLIEPLIHSDERGYFYESFKNSQWEIFFLETKFIQENKSFSKFGVLRGLHFQRDKFAQAKLIQVTHGEVLDVVVDLRKNSKTFGNYLKFKLSCENNLQLFVPRGLAHGFLVLSPNASFSYKVDNIYSKDHEEGIRFDDEILNIDWKFDKKNIIVSKKDRLLPVFNPELSYFS